MDQVWSRIIRIVLVKESRIIRIVDHPVKRPRLQMNGRVGQGGGGRFSCKNKGHDDQPSAA